MSVQSLVASITGYTKTDIETIVTLLLVLSLVIGLLTNLPSISFLSKKNTHQNENSVNTVFKHFSHLTTSSILEDKKHHGESSKKKKMRTKKEFEDENSSISVDHYDSRSSPSKNQSKRNHVMYTLRCIFILLSPILLFSAIPSFYPIYKSYVAPILPDFLQHFFTDIKNLFLGFVNLIATGAILDASYQSDDLVSLFGNNHVPHPVPYSMEDWIYSYIRHCDLPYQYSLHSFCLTCTSPTWVQKGLVYHTADVCVPCDQCITEVGTTEESFSIFDKTSCRDLVNDLSKIVNVNNHYLNKSFTSVMIDCISTFLLYNRFFAHLFYRMVMHSLHRLYIVILQVLKYYVWMSREIVRTFPTDKSRSFALLFILLLMLFLTVGIVRITVRIILFILQIMYPAIFKNAKKEYPPPSQEERKSPQPLSPDLIEFNSEVTEDSSVIADRIQKARRMSNESKKNVKPAWFTSEIEKTYHGSSVTIEDHWKSIVKEIPAIAELIVTCNYTSDEFEWLIKLLEQLYKEKEISFNQIEAIRAVVATRPSSTPPTGFNRYSTRPAPSNPYPFSPVQETQSSNVFSPLQEGKRLSRVPSTSGFGRVVRPPFFRMQNTLKGKPMGGRNSVGSEMSNWNGVKNDKEELL